MNGSHVSGLSPVALVLLFWRHRQLIRQLTWREISQRYRGTVLGFAWSLLTPLIMLLIYTFVFSTVFPSRWGSLPPSQADFAILLFVGLCIHSFFADVINRSPALVLDNPSYVKRVVFPLDILPVVSVGSASFQLMINLLVLVCAQYVVNPAPSLVTLFLPVVIAPLMLVVLGCAWFLASLGVFLRDISSVLAPFTAALMFLSPVFYSQDAVPQPYRRWLELNPLTFMIEQTRGILIFGHQPDWARLAAYTAAALLVAWCGYVWFQLTRRGFSDVI